MLFRSSLLEKKQYRKRICQSFTDRTWNFQKLEKVGSQLNSLTKEKQEAQSKQFLSFDTLNWYESCDLIKYFTFLKKYLPIKYLSPLLFFGVRIKVHVTQNYAGLLSLDSFTVEMQCIRSQFLPFPQHLITENQDSADPPSLP